MTSELGGRPDAAVADLPRGHAVHAPPGGGLIAPGPGRRSLRRRHLVSPAPAGPATAVGPRTADHAAPAGADGAATAHPAQAQVGRAPDPGGPDIPQGDRLGRADRPRRDPASSRD